MAKNWFGILAYIIGITAIIFTVVMLALVVFKWRKKPCSFPSNFKLNYPLSLNH